MEQKIRVAILDDHPPIIEGYTSRLQRSTLTEVVGSALCGADLEAILASTPVDVLLMDVHVPIEKGSKSNYPILSVIPRLLKTYKNLSILTVSMYEQPSLIRSVLESGASGYVLKEDPYFLDALPEIILLVAQGGMYISPKARPQFMQRAPAKPQLTRRQLQVLEMCAAFPEDSTTDLADRMRVAPSTIRNLLSGAYLQLEVHNRGAAVAKAQQFGLIAPANLSISLDKLSDDSKL